jgi:hypothetical protein
MATSGTWTFNPTIADAIDEAWERCGKDPEDMTARHARSAIRSLGYMLTAWSNLKILQWTVDLQEQVTSVGMTQFTPPPGTIDLLDVTLFRDGHETPMSVMSRMDYHHLPSKDQQGRPDQFFVERQITPTVFIWPAGENATDVIRYYRIRQIEDVGRLSSTADIPARFQDAFVAGLAARMAVKFAPDRKAALEGDAITALSLAMMEDRERADMRFRVRMGVYGRR